jgi:hypothetical protein
MRIAGNLDAEVTWARMDAAARRARGEKAPSPDDPRFALPEPVMRKISAAATLLRVFAQCDDDVLWTPRPVDPSRMARVEWLPTPRLESGPVPETADVWWGEPTEVAARVNHRAFAFDVNWREFKTLPGSALVRTVEELVDAAGTFAHEHLILRSSGAWVAKAPYSAAGRLRVRGRGGEVDEAARVQAQRLLDLQGVLVFEPWVDRILDFGAASRVGDGPMGSPVLHRLEVDGAGRFAGIAHPADGLDAQAGTAVGYATRVASTALREAGYAGPFGIDGYLFGQGYIHCVSEINARWTFGMVAREAMDLCRGHLGVDDDERLRLRFGRGAAAPDSIPLLLPGDGDDTSAWLEVAARHGG